MKFYQRLMWVLVMALALLPLSLKGQVAPVPVVAPLPVCSTSTSGQGISLVFTANLTTVNTALTSSATISVNGGSPVPLTSWVWAVSGKNLPYAYGLVPTATILKSTDVLTISWPTGWASTTLGTVGAATNLAVTNTISQADFTLAPGPRSMLIGTNLEGDNVAQTAYRYVDLAHRIQGPLGLTSDGNGYPLTSTGPTIGNVAYIQPQLMAGGAMDGYYAFDYDSAIDTLSFNAINLTITEILPLQRLTGGVGNRRVFRFQASGNQASVWLQITSNTKNPADPTGATWLHDLQNLRILAPDPADPTRLTAYVNPPKWHPQLDRSLAGLRGLRTMDLFWTNNSNMVDYADLVPASRLGYVMPTRTEALAVAEFRGYTGTDPAFDTTAQVIAQITLAAPPVKPLVDGMFLVYSGSGTVTLTNGQTLPASWAGGNIRVLSPTVFLVRISNGPGGQAMTNVLTGGTVGYSVGSGMPVCDIIDRANSSPSLTDLWLNVPFTANDDWVTQLGSYCGANLRRGVKVHVEFSNECWNPSFWQWYSCCVLTRTLGLGGFNDYVPGYCVRTNQVHNLFVAAMGLYGRSNDVIRTFGTQGAGPGYTQQIAAFCQTNKIPIDELAVAPYFDNGPPEPSLQPIYDTGLTTDQQIDLCFLNLKYNGLITGMTASHRAILNASGFTSTALVCYEGGPDVMICPSAVNHDARNQAVTWHPRMFAWNLAFLQALQDNGISQFYRFYYAGTISQYSWSTYWLPNQLPGTGDPVLDLLNITNPQSPLVRSQAGGADQRWAALVPKPTITPLMPPILVPFMGTTQNGSVVTGSISFTMGGITVTAPPPPTPVNPSPTPITGTPR